MLRVTLFVCEVNYDDFFLLFINRENDFVRPFENTVIGDFFVANIMHDAMTCRHKMQTIHRFPKSGMYFFGNFKGDIFAEIIYNLI